MAKILVTSEMIIQRLLSEAGVGGIEAAAVWGSPKPPENYGIGVPITFASPGGIMLDKPHIYAVPSRLAIEP
jgi:hypothetical protein